MTPGAVVSPFDTTIAMETKATEPRSPVLASDAAAERVRPVVGSIGGEQAAEKVEADIDPITGYATRLHDTQEALRESEARYRALTALSSDWYWEHDAEQRFTRISEHVQDRTGIAISAVIGKTRWETNIHYDMAERAALEADMAARRPFYDFQFARAGPNGALRHLSVSGEAMVDTSGRYLGYRGIGKDITERKRAQAAVEESQRALRESEARFRSLTGLSADWYWQQDETLRFQSLCNGTEIKAGLHPDADLGKARWELDGIGKADWEGHKATLAARKPFRDFEVKRTFPDGSVRDTCVSGEPIFDADGKFTGYRGIGRDITERKRAEDQQRFQALLERM